MNTRMKMAASTLALAFTVAGAMPALAQQTMQDMDMTDMPMPKHHAHGQPKQRAKASKPAAQHAMHAASGPALNPRSPDYSDGHAYGPMTGMDMHDDPALGMLLLDRLEWVHSRGGGSALAVDGEAWYGRNFDKLWLKFEGSFGEAFRTEASWSHAVAPFWNAQLGLRHDFGAGPDRTWAAFGIEGLAPYWFETGATFYLGQGGRAAARVAFEYEARFTQRLILRPSLEANWYGQDDPQRGIGSGLSDVEAGLRLRYEIHREFAPYAGVVWQRRFGRSRDYARAQGEPADDLQFVAGVRLWF